MARRESSASKNKTEEKPQKTLGNIWFFSWAYKPAYHPENFDKKYADRAREVLQNAFSWLERDESIEWKKHALGSLQTAAEALYATEITQINLSPDQMEGTLLLLGVLVTKGDMLTGDGQQMVTEEAPQKYPRLYHEADLKTLRPREYGEKSTWTETVPERVLFAETKEYRPTVEALALAADLALQYPEATERALLALEEGTEGHITSFHTALGTLELLNNLSLLYDPNFGALAHNLRSFVLNARFDDGSAVDIDWLRNHYTYTIIHETPFWHSRNTPYMEPAPTERIYFTQEEPEDKADQKRAPIEFPDQTNWHAAVKRIEGYTNRIDELTLPYAIRTNAQHPRPTRDTLGTTFRGQRQEKQTLRLTKPQDERHSFSSAQTQWKTFFENISPTAVDGPNRDRFNQFVTMLAEVYSTDTRLSSKAKTYLRDISNHLERTPDKPYGITQESLARPLTRWLSTLSDVDWVDVINQAEKQTEEFQVLTKLMLADILHVSFLANETSFMFSDTIEDKTAVGRLKAKLPFLSKTKLDQTNEEQPAFMDVVIHKRDRFEYLLAPKVEKKIRRKIARLQRNDFFSLPTDLKAGTLHISYENLKKIAKVLGYTALTTLAASLLVGTIEAVKQGLIKFPDGSQGSGESGDQGGQTPDAPKPIFPPDPDGGIDSVINRLIKENKGGNGSGNESQTRLSGNAELNPEDLKNTHPRAWGKIIHWPKSWGHADGKGIGFFPENQLWNREIIGKHFENVTVVPSLDDVPDDFPDEALVYRPRNPAYPIYPPTGYKITRIYTTEPFTGDTQGPLTETFVHGTIDGAGTMLNEVIVVAEPLEITDINSRVHEIKGIINHGYFPNVQIDQRSHAYAVNTWLDGDPELQALHKDYLDAYYGTVDAYNASQTNGSPMSDEDFKRYISDVMIEYTEKYSAYTNNNRYYALKFNTTGLIAESALERIADNKDSGYFCYVAALAYEGFINSPNTTSEIQLGYPLVSYGDIMYQRLGHANNYAFLPDGRVLQVDMTPNVTDKTPQEDLDALNANTLPKDMQDQQNKLIVEQIAREQQRLEEQKRIEIIKTLGEAGLGLTALISVTLVGLLGLETKRRLKRRKNYNAALKNMQNRPELSPIEKRVITNVIYSMATIPYQGGKNSFYAQAEGILERLQSVNLQENGDVLEMLLEEEDIYTRASISDTALQQKLNVSMPAEEFSNYVALARLIHKNQARSLEVAVKNSLYASTEFSEETQARYNAEIAFKLEEIHDIMTGLYMTRETPEKNCAYFGHLTDILESTSKDA